MATPLPDIGNIRPLTAGEPTERALATAPKRPDYDCRNRSEQQLLLVVEKDSGRIQFEQSPVQVFQQEFRGLHD